MTNFNRAYRHHSPERISGSDAGRDIAVSPRPPLKLVEAVRRQVASLRQRRQLHELLRCDEDTLADIGYSRAEIMHALHGRRRVSGGHGVNYSLLQNMHPMRPRVRH